MDHSYGGSLGSWIANTSQSWTSKDEQVRADNQPHAARPGRATSFELVPSDIPQGTAGHTMTVASRPLSILPPPQQILRSQTWTACRVCGKTTCELDSHKRYNRAITSGQVLLGQENMSRATTMAVDLQGLQLPPGAYVHHLPVIDGESQKLFSLWYQPWSLIKRGPERHLHPVRWIDNVLPNAQKHAPLMQALLATVTSMWASTNLEANDVSPPHLQSALQMLSDSSADATTGTDECILGYICLMLVFVAKGNEVETERLFTIVLRLVTLRGGPSYLGFRGVIAELLLHADFMQATHLVRPPVFPMLLPALEIGLPPRLGASFRALAPCEDLSRDVLLAADSLCRSADIYALPPARMLNATGAVNAFGYLSTVSEYQLARCNQFFAGSQGWNEVICIALLIFNNTVLHSHGGVDAVIQRLEHRFWSTIDVTIFRVGFGKLPRHLVLWVLMTGLTPSIYQRTTSQYRSRALDRLRAARVGISLDNWNDVCHQVLEPHLWIRAAQEETFRDIWFEVEGRRS